jgi:hypothetical protein
MTTTHCCRTRATLAAFQARKLAELTAELETLVAEGNEYHAMFVRQDIGMWSQPIRLLHRHETA